MKSAQEYLRKHREKLSKKLKKRKVVKKIMGGKLLWTGLTFIVAVIPFLKALGLNGEAVLVLVGAVIMVIGCILMWLDK